MDKLFSSRRVAAFVCLAVVLFAVLTFSADGPLLPVVFLLLCFGSISIAALLPGIEEQKFPQQLIAIPAFCPRPPPAH